jgi:hypothetical protein
MSKGKNIEDLTVISHRKWITLPFYPSQKFKAQKVIIITKKKSYRPAKVVHYLIGEAALHFARFQVD